MLPQFDLEYLFIILSLVTLFEAMVTYLVFCHLVLYCKSPFQIMNKFEEKI